MLPDPLAPLDRAETWLRKRPEDPELLASCARLCLRAELIGKARSYLEASIARRPSAENSLILADLLEQMGERDERAEVPARSGRPLRRPPADAAASPAAAPLIRRQGRSGPRLPCIRASVSGA